MITFPHSVMLCDLEDISMPGWFLLPRHFDIIEDGTIYRAPAGMLTDGASIPRVAWLAIGSPFTGRYLRGAVTHDAGYQGTLLCGPNEDTLISCTLSKIEIDGLFYRLMLARGVGRKRALAMHIAVRVGGWKAWRKTRSGSVNGA